MAPMTRWRSPNQFPGADVAAYYRRRAENEVGLIVTEGTTIDHRVSSYSVRTPAFHGKALEGWRRVVREVHDAGSWVYLAALDRRQFRSRVNICLRGQPLRTRL
jgi:2,4-dienoyl-CoA reductase-like NADH-dependent reductase (Old Yellow Enzyme family)